MTEVLSCTSANHRLHFAGYRVYFLKRGALLVILLAGGAKPTQDKDIQTALKLARLL